MRARVIYLLSFLLLLFSCLSSEEPLSPSGPVFVLEESVRTMDLSPGERNDVLTLSDGSLINVRISVPEIESDEKVPLILGLHWSGNPDTYNEFMTCLVEPGLKPTGAIIISPSYATGAFYNDRMIVVLTSFLDHAKQHWPIDSQKTAFVGFSNGAISGWYFAATIPSYFTAGIVIGGDYSDGAKLEIPMYVIHGDQDELFDINRVGQIIENARRKGSDITFVTAEGYGHYEACRYIPFLNDAGSWLLNEIW